MQNRYVGDVGDFGNNGLLRWLCGVTSPDSGSKLRLGVVQYSHPDEPSNGGHIGYLSRTPENSQEFQKCDPDLYYALKDLVFKGNRTISAAQKTFKRKEILPSNTLYYDPELSYGPEESTPERRKTRACWLKGAFNATCKAKIVFFNPDNGLAKQESPTSKKGTKYVFMDDLKCFAENGNSLVIYHHLGRKNHDQQISSIAIRLACNLRSTCMEFPVHCLDLARLLHSLATKGCCPY